MHNYFPLQICEGIIISLYLSDGKGRRHCEEELLWVMIHEGHSELAREICFFSIAENHFAHSLQTLLQMNILIK